VGGVPALDSPRHDSSGRRLLLALLAVGRRLKSRSAVGGLDSASVFVLHNVQGKEPLRVSELARCMALDASTVSRHVMHLVHRGYLIRTGDPDDRRACRLRLTDRGRALLEEAMAARVAIVDDAIAHWPAHDRETLTTLMTRLAADLDRPEADLEAG
jgi:DNA-binding MarR family transcriptional regulator